MSSHSRGSGGSRFADIYLELVGIPDVEKRDKPSIKILAKSQTQLRFIVQNIPATLDGDTADSLSALLLDELDRLPVPGRLTKVQIASLKFTQEGAVSLSQFLRGLANTVRHFALHSLLNHGEDESESIIQEDMHHVKQILSAFAESPLSVLDLSHNRLYGSEVWFALQPSRREKLNLKQLILDSVDLDEESWLILESDLTKWDNMEDLHIVLERAPPSDAAIRAALALVRQCHKLSSLRWIQKRDPEQPLPWRALRDVAQIHPRGGNLRHLVLEGPGTPDFVQAQDLANLSSALQDFPRLRTLKLRHLGLMDVNMLVASLKGARPPLEVIDFSYNEISAAGAARLVELKSVSPQLSAIILNDNRLETRVAQDLLQTYGSACQLHNNPGVDLSKLVIDLLKSKSDLERERNDLRQKLELRPPVDPLVDQLQKDNRRLRQERDILAQAFALATRPDEERTNLLERIQRLEDLMVLNAVLKDGGAGIVRNAATAGGAGVPSGVLNDGGRRQRIPVSQLEHYGGRSSSGRSVQSVRSAGPAVGSDVGDRDSSPVLETPVRPSNRGFLAVSPSLLAPPFTPEESTPRGRVTSSVLSAGRGGGGVLRQSSYAGNLLSSGGSNSNRGGGRALNRARSNLEL